MVSIRQATMDDLLGIQTCNQISLQENDQINFYLSIMIPWPQLVYVAEDYNKKIVGYVMGRMDEESTECRAHIVSLVVLRTHRKLGLATKLITLAHNGMEALGARYISLHLRKSSLEAFQLYHQTLGYKIHDILVKYYPDGEDAYDMHKPLNPKSDYQEQQSTVASSSSWELESGLSKQFEPKSERKHYHQQQDSTEGPSTSGAPY